MKRNLKLTKKNKVRKNSEETTQGSEATTKMKQEIETEADHEGD